MTADAEAKRKKASRTAGGRIVPPGRIVAAIDWAHLAHELVTQRGRARRLELVYLADELRVAIKWRVTNLTPLVASPAYASLWLEGGDDRRRLMLRAIFESGDFHYGSSNRERRQILARWMHARLAAAPAPEPSA